MAYTGLLQADPAVDPSSVSQSTLEEIRNPLVGYWRQLSRDGREQTQAVPAVWTTPRKALSHGDSSDCDRERSIIAKLASERTSHNAQGRVMSDDALQRSPSLATRLDLVLPSWPWESGV